jgi:hypothetical protein
MSHPQGPGKIAIKVSCGDKLYEVLVDCCVGGKQDQPGLADASSFWSSARTEARLCGVPLLSGCTRHRGCYW